MAGKARSKAQDQTRENQSQETGGSTPSVRQPRGNQAACANLPTAVLNLSNLGATSVAIALPGGVSTGTLSLGGSLTAKEKCSGNPTTVANTGVGVGSGGGETTAGTDGSISAKLSSTLAGVTNSVSVKLNGGAPAITIGSLGTFGAQYVSTEPLPTGGVKVTYESSPKDVKLERNGVEITGNISCTLDVVVQPLPQAPWYERAWNWISETAGSFADWVWENRTEILVGVGMAALAVGAAIAIAGTGGAATPMVAPALGS